MNIITTAWLASLTLIIACGDKSGDTGHRHDTAALDADADADADAQTTVVYTSSDYSVYALGTVDMETGVVTDEITTLPGGGSLVKTLQDGRVYNLNQMGVDVLRVYEAGIWTEPSWEISVGDGTANPHDTVLCGGELYVSLYGGSSIHVYNPETGALTGAVDLSAHADADGIAEVDTLFCKDDTVYAVAQLMYEWVSTNGAILAIDTVTNEVISATEVSPNPRAFAHPSDDNQLFLLTGHYGASDGAIATYDLTAGEESSALILDVDLGISFAAFVTGETHAMVLGSTHDYTATKLFCLDMNDWTNTEIWTSGGYTSVMAGDDQGMAWMGLPADYAAEAFSVGLQRFDIDACTIHGELMETNLQPYTISFY